MKKTLYIILIVLNLFLFALVVHCAVEHPSPNNYKNELSYSLSSNKNYYSIVDCLPGVEDKIEIPKSYNNLPVTHIAENAFAKCKDVEEIIISDSISVIDKNAFLGCESLEKIKVDEANDIYDSRYDCNAVIESKTKTLIVGTSTTVIPEKIIHIGAGAFNGRKGLENIEFPSNSDLVSIGAEAFANCSNLTSFTVTKNVSYIGEKAFAGCSSLTSLNVEDGNAIYDSRNGSNAIIEKASNKLMFGCNSTTVPSSVVEINSYAFLGASRLNNIIVPESVLVIGEYAFADCESLQAITLPQTLKTIKNNAFANCRSLLRFRLPKETTDLGQNVLLNCVGLNEIAVEDGNTKYDSRQACNAIIETANSSILYGCKATKIPTSVAEIASYAFSSCDIKKLVIDDNIKLINENAFNNCTSLETIVILNKNIEIKNNAFNSCSNISEVYYIGNVDEWYTSSEKISKSGNESLYSAQRYYYSADEPTKEEDYWHYNASGEIVIWK